MVPSSGGDLYSIEELLTFFDAKPEPIISRLDTLTQIKQRVDDVEVNEILMSILRTRKICVHDQLKSRNPKHDARVFLVMFLMKYYSINDTFEINRIFEKFAAEFNYDDVHNLGDRLDQIRSICENPKYRIDPQPHSCTKLKRCGLCYKNVEKCPYYRSDKV
jgi:hypothetical protein